MHFSDVGYTFFLVIFILVDNWIKKFNSIARSKKNDIHI